MFKYLLAFLFILSCLFCEDPFLQEFETFLTEKFKSSGIPGMAVCIVQDGKIASIKTYGKRGVHDDRPVDENTLFQIGSLSKAFTTTLAAMAVDNHLINWNDSIQSHAPSFMMFDPWVTRAFLIEDLFAQHSGLAHYAGDLQAFLGYNQETMFGNLKYFEPKTSFRSTYSYQNLFFNLGAAILKSKTGKGYSELLAEKLFRPLNMKNSTNSLEDYLKADNRMEWTYKNNKGSFMQIPFQSDLNNWNYVLNAAGGINSTVKDMSNWLLFQVNLGEYEGRQLVSKENLSKTHLPITYITSDLGAPLYYCLGWVTSLESPHRIILHDGSTLGTYNAIGFSPDEKLGILILSNGRGTNLSLELLFNFFDLYYGREPRTLPKKEPLQGINPPKFKANLAEYVGEYQHPVYGTAKVSDAQDKLILTLGEKPIRFEFIPISQDYFSFTWEPIEEKPYKVIFNRGLQGTIERITIENITDDGSGDFHKIR